MRKAIIAAALCLLTFNAPAFAADKLTEAMSAAYAPYRTALFKTNGQSKPEAEQAIVQARRSWPRPTRHWKPRAT